MLARAGSRALRDEVRRPGDAWRRENYRRWRCALRQESLNFARRVAEWLAKEERSCAG